MGRRLFARSKSAGRSHCFIKRRFIEGGGGFIACHRLQVIILQCNISSVNNNNNNAVCNSHCLRPSTNSSPSTVLGCSWHLLSAVGHQQKRPSPMVSWQQVPQQRLYTTRLILGTTAVLTLTAAVSASTCLWESRDWKCRHVGINLRSMALLFIFI